MKVDVYHDGTWLCTIGRLKPRNATRDAINIVKDAIEIAKRRELSAEADYTGLDPAKLTAKKQQK